MNALRLDPSTRTFAQLYETRREPLFSRKTVVTVGITALCYGGLGFYFVTIKSAPLPPQTIEEPGPIVLRSWRMPPPQPVPATKPPATARHTEAPSNPTVSPLPFADSSTPASESMPTDFSTFIGSAAPAGPAGPVGPTTAEPAGPPAPSVIRNPVWISRPTASQAARLYPVRASDRGLSGKVTLLCTIRINGSMAGCQVVSESPTGWRFGEAALDMARYFRVSPKTVDGAAVEGSQVQIPINFSLAD